MILLNFSGMILIAQRRAGLYRRSGKPEKAVEIFTTAAERSMSIADKIFYYIKAAKIFAKVRGTKICFVRFYK